MTDDEWRMPEELWKRVESLLPPERPHPRGGRPYTPARQCGDGIFYVLRTGCQWKALPRCFDAPSTGPAPEDPAGAVGGTLRA